MDGPFPDQTPPPIQPPPPRPPADGGGGLKKAAGPFAALAGLLAKFKGLLFAASYLKTGGSMLLMMWIYSRGMGWPFAAGFVILIFVHECGHLLVARYLGLKVTTPMFIPFVGALITLKQMPRNAWMEAQVGIGGPLLGSAGAMVCYFIYYATGNPLYRALAYSGFFLNLFNLAPLGFLDGGRIVTALSPWLWLVGAVVILGLLFIQFNLLLVIILILSVPRLFSLFRPKTAAEQRYYEVTPAHRWIIGVMYFGLIVALVIGLMQTQIYPAPSDQVAGLY